MVVRNNHVDANLAAQPFLCCGYHRDSAVELRTRRQQCRAVLKRPTVVLRVRDFHAIGMERFERGNHLFQVIDVLAMDDQVYREGDAVLANPRFANPCCQLNLVRVRASTCDPVRVAFA